MYQSNECRDLFGEYVVTIDDVLWWLEKIPVHLSSSPKRRAIYAADYNIIGKIAAAKASGSFNYLIHETETISNAYDDVNCPCYRLDFVTRLHNALRAREVEKAAILELQRTDAETKRNQRRAICARARRVKAEKLTTKKPLSKAA